MDYKYYLAVFNEYVSTFDMKDLMIKSKYEHTFRVIRYASEIARSINLSVEDIELAKICALFHDIGRFQQASIYHSFIDSETIDHGDLGSDIIKNKLKIDNNILYISTKYHNKYSIPSNLDEREKLFSKITRDADKLDIMFTQNLDDNDTSYVIPNKTFECLKNHKEVTKSSGNKTDSNIILVHIGFIYDLSFIYCFKKIKDYNLVNKKIDLIYNKFHKPELLTIRDEINKYIDNKLEGK